VPRLSPSAARQLLAALAIAATALVIVILTVGPTSSRAQRRSLESMFQDDDHLVYGSTATVVRTLDQLRRLGVQRIRVTVLWRAIAPDPHSRAMPPGFNGSDPAAYPPRSWAPYDRVVELAHARDIAVDFDVGAPGPLWAMARGSPAPRYADHWRPSASAFAQFVAAVGRRYSGSYRAGASGSAAGASGSAPSASGSAPIPRVSFWSIWNEPNQPGWLAPQWQDTGGGRVVESAVLYRGYVNAGWGALVRSGHGPSGDTILIGELAPEGSEGPTYTYRSPIPPMPFLRALYCVDAAYRPLTGPAAAALACPRTGGAAAFVAANPGLFDASGFAHHPYSFFLAPNAPMANGDYVPLSELGRLERGLDAIFDAYGVGRRLPLYLTEYGYGTNPPNPFVDVSPALQALYLNEAEYMAWRDPRVRDLSQFLLYDSPPNHRYPKGSRRYWSTFQTGLLNADGSAKPALDAYGVPIFIPDPVLGASRKVLVWARLRPATPGSVQAAQIQWSPTGGAFRTLVTARTDNPSGVLTSILGVPGPGAVRISWADGAGHVLYSREATVNQG
jgi:hypothetical protein